MALPYPSKVFTPFDQLPASDLNEMVANDEALAAGTGLDDGAVKAIKTSFGGNYTTSEVNTGFTWIDGKPIYKRTFVLDSGTSTTYNYAHGIPIATCIKCEGIIANGTPPAYIPSAPDYSVVIFGTPTNISVRRGAYATTGEIIATIFYTKTA